MQTGSMKHLPTLTLLLGLLACGAPGSDGGGAQSATAEAAGTTHAFNTTTGALDVDYAGHLS